MLNIKLSVYPTIFILSVVTLPILYFIKRRFFYDSIKEKIEPTLSPDEEFIKKNRDKFNETYEESLHIEKYNENVDSIFLNKQLYSEVTKLSDSELELSWRRRILFEFTPRGSVIMFYDSYKQGFSYYSDQTISYAILNAIAMKYVITYRCRDFFIDEQIIPEGHVSRILELSKKEEHDKKKDEKKLVTRIDTTTGPFAKLKSYMKDPIIASTISKKTLNLPKIGDLKKSIPVFNKDVMKNKFISLGKIMNWNILNPVKKNKISSHYKSPLLKSLENNANVQSSILNYKNYKATKNS